MFGSLRLKLTLWHVAVFAGLQLLLIVGMGLWRGHELAEGAIKARIAKAADTIVENILLHEEEGLTSAGLSSIVPRDTLFAALVVREEAGQVLAVHGTKDAGLLPFTLHEQVPSGTRGEVFTELAPEVVRAALGEANPATMVTLPFRCREVDYYLQGVIWPSTWYRIYASYYDLLLPAVPLGMLAAFLAAWLIAGRAVQPIRSLSSAARRMAGGPGNRLLLETRDHEIRVLQGELNETLERLEQTYRAQQRFVSNLSHEVKTPIAVLLTEAQILKIGEATRAQLLEFLQHVEVEMKHLGQLVETLLELMRAEHLNGFPHGETFSLEDVVLKGTEHLSPLARAREVRIGIDFPPTPIESVVFGDPRLVRTAFENLLRNAITHSPAGETVVVRSAEGAERVQVEVVDHGPGIPEELMERVFERFFRVPGSQMGTGLGLSIARTVVELHHGEIEVRNNPGGGCTFTISLPVARAQPLQRAGRERAQSEEKENGAPTSGTRSPDTSLRS
jgi:signal transduction histidine kinase